MFPPEVLHTLDESTLMYMIGSLKLTIGDIGPGKTLKNDIENLHHTIHHEIKRNREQDFPRGSQNMPLDHVIFVIFGDKSHLDLKGTLSTIPIIFTFTCFNQDARNKVENWRPLSFLPNLSHGVLSSKNEKSNKKNPVLSVQDEHNCLWVAFSSLVYIYPGGGIKATVMGRDVIVKPWIHFFV